MKKNILRLCLALALMVFACKQDENLSLSPAIQTPSKKNTFQTSAVSDYGTYTITCVAGGKYIEVDGNIIYNEKFQDSKLLVQYGPTQAGNLWQKWQVIYKTTANNTKYYHIMNLHSGKLLSVPGGFTIAGLQLEQYPNYGSDAQLWRIQELGTTGTYNITNKATGLAITNKNASTVDGTPIVQEALGTADKQKWRMNAVAADVYRDDAVVRFFNRNSASQGSVAFDQGNSVPLTYGTNNGKVLWITQDAWDGASLQSNTKFNCNSFHSYSNSVLIQPSINDWHPGNTPNITISNSTSAKPKQVFNIYPGTSWNWAGPGVEIGDKVYVQCDEGNGLDPISQSLYQLTQSTTSNQWTAVRTTPAGMSNQVAIRYQTGMVKGTDGYVYAFGSQATGFGYSGNVYVARFPITNPQAWTFWNGSSWTNTPTTGDAARISDALTGSNSVAFLNGKYILMTMNQGFNCDGNRGIYLSTSTSPTGPFTARKLVYTIKEYFYGQYARYYTPIIHPEFSNGRDELLLTYSLNFSACGLNSCQDGYMDPYFYRIKGVRVPYSLLP